MIKATEANESNFSVDKEDFLENSDGIKKFYNESSFSTDLSVALSLKNKIGETEALYQEVENKVA